MRVTREDLERCMEYFPGDCAFYAMREGRLELLRCSSRVSAFFRIAGPGARGAGRPDALDPVWEGDREQVRRAAAGLTREKQRAELTFYAVRGQCVVRLRVKARVVGTWDGRPVIAAEFMSPPPENAAAAPEADEGRCGTCCSEEREKLRRLRAAAREAERANEAKSDFLYSVTHDMRTPLSGVIGFTELALQTGDPAEREECLVQIRRAGSILLRLVDDTLDLSRIERRKLALRPEPVDAAELVESIAAAIRPSAREKNITFTVRADWSRLPRIRVDRLRIQQIFLNLLSNAVKFTPEGGRVELIIRRLDPPDRGANCRLTVRDNGRGMRNEFLAHAFEPFSQDECGTDWRQSGAGLGLAIVRKLVDRMGGFIELHSRQGEGTRFDVYLNLEKAEDLPPERPAAAQEDLAGKRVLVCEDHPINREMIRRVLERRGVLVSCAPDGKQGVSMFARSPWNFYDAILMDIRMPVMNGIEAARAIRGLDRPDAAAVPILAMTADAFWKEREKTMAAGMTVHLTKPIDTVRLCQALAGVT